MTQPRILRCPNCKTNVDASAFKIGSIIKCPKCTCGMKVVDPSQGATTIVTQETVEAAVASPRKSPTQKTTAVAPRGRMSPIMRKMAGARNPGSGPRKPQGTGFERGGAARDGSPVKVILIGAGVVVGIGIIAIVALSQGKKPDKKLGENKPGVTYSQPDQPVIPDTPQAGVFGPGARDHTGPEFGQLRIPDPAAYDDFKRRARNKEFDGLLPAIATNFPCALRAAVEDEEAVARGAFSYIEFVYNQKILKAQQRNNFVKWESFWSPKWRGGTVEVIAKVWNKDHEKIVAGAHGVEIDEGGGDPANPDTPTDPSDKPEPITAAEWPKIVESIRVTAGIGPEADRRNRALARLRSNGPKCWDNLFPYINDEDIGVSRAVVDTLNQLAAGLTEGKFKSDRPTDETKANIKAAWEEWFKTLK